MPNGVPLVTSRPEALVKIACLPTTAIDVAPSEESALVEAAVPSVRHSPLAALNNSALPKATGVGPVS